MGNTRSHAANATQDSVLGVEHGALHRRGATGVLAGRVSVAASLATAAFLIVSALPATAQTEPYQPPKQVTLSPTGVDLASGHFTTKSVDLAIGPFVLERSYIGGHAIDGSNYFGPNWTHNYADFISEGDPGTDKTHIVIGRSMVHFSKGLYAPADTFYALNPDSFGSSLTVVGGAFVYTDRDGNVYTFNPSVNAFAPLPGRRNQRIARIDYADGHTLVYTYNSASQLVQIASNEGYSLVFEYGVSGFVSKACGYNRALTYVSAASTCAGATLSVSYSYGSVPNMASFTDVNGQVWGYDYDDSGNVAGDNGNVSKLTCVRQVNSSACLISNAFLGDKPAVVTQQTAADGGVWNYIYDFPVKSGGDDPQLPGEPPPTSAGGYTDPVGLSVNAAFAGGLLGSYTESFTTNPSDPWATVHKTTTLTWNGIEMESLAYTEGNKVFYTRDNRENVTLETWTPKPGSGLSPVSRTTVFPDSTAADCTTVVRRLCNKPVSKTDYNGNQTDFTYDPASGGMLTMTGPAVNGVRPQTRKTYVQRYAWVKTSSGAYVQETTPIWLPATEKTCRTSATVSGACAAGAGDEVVTTYEYGPDSGPNNLRLRGKVVTANGISLRTCLTYDDAGNQISQTSPRGTLALTVCP